MNEKTILVVGGAGYIGSHTCLELARQGFTPVVFDNLSNGHQEFVKWGPFEPGDIRDRARLDGLRLVLGEEAVETAPASTRCWPDTGPPPSCILPH